MPGSDTPNYINSSNQITKEKSSKLNKTAFSSKLNVPYIKTDGSNGTIS